MYLLLVCYLGERGEGSCWLAAHLVWQNFGPTFGSLRHCLTSKTCHMPRPRRCPAPAPASCASLPSSVALQLACTSMCHLLTAAWPYWCTQFTKCVEPAMEHGAGGAQGLPINCCCCCCSCPARAHASAYHKMASRDKTSRCAVAPQVRVGVISGRRCVFVCCRYPNPFADVSRGIAVIGTGGLDALPRCAAASGTKNGCPALCYIVPRIQLLLCTLPLQGVLTKRQLESLASRCSR
jgi:hypothetical protein